MSAKDKASTPTIERRFYSLQELNELGLGSESLLRKAIKEGRLPVHRFGSAYRISQEDLDLYLDAARVPSPHVFDNFANAVVDAAPKLSDEQRQQLVTVLGSAV